MKQRFAKKHFKTAIDEMNDEIKFLTRIVFLKNGSMIDRIRFLERCEIGRHRVNVDLLRNMESKYGLKVHDKNACDEAWKYEFPKWMDKGMDEF